MIVYEGLAALGYESYGREVQWKNYEGTLCRSGKNYRNPFARPGRLPLLRSSTRMHALFWPSLMRRILRLGCKCGAKKEVPVEGDAAFKSAALDWLREHRPCQGGVPFPVVITGQHESTSPPIPIGRVVLKG